MNDEFLSLKEAASFLKRSPGNVYALVCSGDLKHYKPSGKLLLFKRADLQSWIEAGAVSSIDKTAAQPARRS